MVLVWYVIQVIKGREDVMRERIERVVPASAMQELFYPQFQTEIKVHGEWVNTTKPLFPGYLICDTADPRTVQQYLLRMDDFARVLSQDGQFVPLPKRRGTAYWQLYSCGRPRSAHERGLKGRRPGRSDGRSAAGPRRPYQNH